MISIFMYQILTRSRKNDILIRTYIRKNKMRGRAWLFHIMDYGNF